MGPRPAVAAVRSAVRAVLADTPVLVACSGGPDSVALAAAVAFEAPRAGLPYALMTVDHRLQDGSVEQAATVADLGYELGFDPVQVAAVDIASGAGPEAGARAARYQALDSFAAALGADLLLGHTLDDQAESVLLGLGRGSGPRSIAGMRIRDGRHVRPLLGLRRRTTVEACADLGLPTWDDPHNTDPRYQRVRLRTEVLPLLEDVLQGGVAEALARPAGQLQDQLDVLSLGMSCESRAHDSHDIPGETSGIDADQLAGLPRALRTDRLRRWALAQGAAEMSAVHVDELDRLVTAWHGQGPIDLPGGLRACRASGRLEILPPEQPS